jgi:hypothetical protein
MKSLILSEFDSCKLSVKEMSRTKGGNTMTKGKTSICPAGDSDTGTRDSCNNSGGIMY